MSNPTYSNYPQNQMAPPASSDPGHIKQRQEFAPTPNSQYNSYEKPYQYPNFSSQQAMMEAPVFNPGFKLNIDEVNFVPNSQQNTQGSTNDNFPVLENREPAKEATTNWGNNKKNQKPESSLFNVAQIQEFTLPALFTLESAQKASEFKPLVSTFEIPKEATKSEPEDVEVPQEPEVINRKIRFTFDEIMALQNKPQSQEITPQISQILTRKYEKFQTAKHQNDRKSGNRQHRNQKHQPAQKEIVQKQIAADPNQWRIIDEKAEMLIKQAEANRLKSQESKSEDEKTMRKIRITLNKLSQQNFDKLKDNLFQIAIEAEQNLIYMVEGLFHKACVEPKYTEMYGYLCQYITEKYLTFQFNEEQLKLKGRKANRENLFRRVLLQLAQHMFEYNPNEEDFTHLSEEDATVKRDLLRKKVIGNSRLIGELFKQKIIHSKVILKCIEQLLDMDREQDIQRPLNDDRVEAACTLLNTGNKHFDSNNIIQETDRIFQHLQQVVDSQLTSTRLRFLVMNVIDARAGRWE